VYPVVESCACDKEEESGSVGLGPLVCAAGGCKRASGNNTHLSDSGQLDCPRHWEEVDGKETSAPRCMSLKAVRGDQMANGLFASTPERNKYQRT
jgi:hypothetical protein